MEYFIFASNILFASYLSIKAHNTIGPYGPWGIFYLIFLEYESKLAKSFMNSNYLIKCLKYFNTWWTVHATVLPVAATFFTARMTIAATLASNPVVGSSRKMILGLETSSTAIVSRLRCSVDSPFAPGSPTKVSRTSSSSIVSRTSLTKS